MIKIIKIEKSNLLISYIRYEFLRDRYQGDKLIGKVRVDFSSFCKKQKN